MQHSRVGSLVILALLALSGVSVYAVAPVMPVKAVTVGTGSLSLSTLGADFDAFSALATPYLSQALVGVVAGLFVYFVTRKRTKEE